MNIRRRDLCRAGSTLLGATMFSSLLKAQDPEELRAEYLRTVLLADDNVRDWLRGKRYPFARYDAGLGYVHVNRDFKEGVGGTICRYRYGRLGARQMLAYAQQACRINTYGDSFTSCEQVSDGETWQEVLARHLCEPVRNYGTGGYSVYQAYLRMLREEERAPADTIIFNIFDDDHYRNILGWQRFKFGVNEISINPTVPYMQVDPENRSVVYHGNVCSRKADVYKLTDLAWVTGVFKHDAYLENRLNRIRDAKAGRPVPPTDYDDEILNHKGLFSTNKVIDLVNDYAKAKGKKVLFVLSYGGYVVKQFVDQGRRFDQPMVDHLKQRGLVFVDLLKAHAMDRNDFDVSTDDYLKRYYVGHYNPMGNHFCAFAILAKLVQMLSPAPASHRPAASVEGGFIK